jgi:hypothetical protein
MKLLIKFPTRERPELFFKTLEKYIAMASGRHEIEIIVSMDNDDKLMNNEAVRERLERIRANGNDLKYFYGNSSTKIEAINADMDKASDNWDMVFNGQDDMIPLSFGYDDMMLSRLVEHYPDTDGALWLDDHSLGGSNNCTIVAAGRKYYERFNHIYYPGYKSLFADNEYTEVGNLLKKLTYIADDIVKHEWIGTNQFRDPLLERNEQPWLYTYDQMVFERRKNLGFPNDGGEVWKSHKSDQQP